MPGKASHSPVAADSWRPLDATEPALESEKAPKYRVSLGWSERNFLSLTPHLPSIHHIIYVPSVETTVQFNVICCLLPVGDVRSFVMKATYD